MRQDRYPALCIILQDRLQSDPLSLTGREDSWSQNVISGAGRPPKALQSANRDHGDLIKQSHLDAELISPIFQPSLYQGQQCAHSNPSAPINNLKEQQTFRPLEKSIKLPRQSCFATSRAAGLKWKASLYLLLSYVPKGNTAGKGRHFSIFGNTGIFVLILLGFKHLFVLNCDFLILSPCFLPQINGVSCLRGSV